MQSGLRKTITAQCIVKNEESFIRYAILSVIQHVDTVLIFDTGSTDKTCAIVRELRDQFQDKIIFEEKGPSDKARHTQLRQEMLEKTKTDWFMILDGDEVWTQRGIEEAVNIINAREDVAWLGSQYYLCVGDVYHTYYKEKFDAYHGRVGFFTGRFIKRTENMKWSGDYEVDMIVGLDGKDILTPKNIYYLKNRYWHLTHLRRSSADDDVYTSGIAKVRKEKRRLTYFLIGKKIRELVPELFDEKGETKKIGFVHSLINFIFLIFAKPGLIFRRIKYWLHLLFRKSIYVRK